MTEKIEGRIIGISGPSVKAKGLEGAAMNTIALVGKEGLLGEIIRIEGDIATIQVYEDTTGVGHGERIISTGSPLKVELGPGLLGTIFDGIQRPLAMMKGESGDFIKRGLKLNALNREKRWDFSSLVSRGDTVQEGDIIGVIDEGEGMEHRVMVPPGLSGIVKEVKSGLLATEDPVAILQDGRKIMMYQEWRVRIPRPYKKKLPPSTPFITGQRIIDTFFPISEGGTAIIPGGFGTGKTVTEQTLAKYSKADIIVYVGCGERGNEMSELLRDFPELIDPKTGKSLLSRTIIIVNTSNMPVAAREASIYTGVTISEYYRDMGYTVALFADSTSRWAEALREISSRMEEMPGEEGYPTYMPVRLGDYYERAGRVLTLGSKEREGSVTIVGAVSPPGGDFSEPVTQASMRSSGALWALDTELAYRRHFPAINWMKSYTLYADHLKEWYAVHLAEDFNELRDSALFLLRREDELNEIVQLIGPDALQDKDRVTLEVGRLLRDGFLRQNAFSSVDAFCPQEKQYWMLKVILHFYEKVIDSLKKGIQIEKILESPLIERILRMQEIPPGNILSTSRDIINEIDKGF